MPVTGKASKGLQEWRQRPAGEEEADQDAGNGEGV